MNLLQTRFFSAALLALVGLTAPLAADPWESTPKKPASDKPAEKTPAQKKLVDEARKVLGPAPAPVDGAAPAAADSAWTIALIAYRGEDADENARLAVHKVRTEGGLAGAYSERRGEAVIVAVGRYSSPDSPEAVSEVKRLKDVVINGQKPYRDAVLVPPANATNLGALPQMNLVNARAMYGDSALYTLQVAVYGRRDLLKPTEEDLAEARKAAETAAVRLRQEGETAFYYHGPRMSMVTVGVFDLEDFDPQTPGYQSPRLAETRKRLPHNLYNGAGIQQKRPGDLKPNLQASTLVAIPTK